MDAMMDAKKTWDMITAGLDMIDDNIFDHRKHRYRAPKNEEEKERRAKNIIVFHMVEKIGKTESIRNAMDREEIIKILAHENQIDLSKIKVKRLGKYDPNRIRPLLITFNTHLESRLAMRNSVTFGRRVVVQEDRGPFH